MIGGRNVCFVCKDTFFPLAVSLSGMKKFVVASIQYVNRA